MIDETEAQRLLEEIFKDCWPDRRFDIWTCTRCKREFVDQEDFPRAKVNDGYLLEVRLYWLSQTEPLCSDCAVQSGIPPIDKE